MSKKLAEKQQRRLAEERKRDERHRAARRRNLVTATVALLITALVVVSIYVTRKAEEEEESAPVGVSVAAADCDDIEEVEDPDKLEREHIPIGTQIEYPARPPVGGNHWPPEAVVDPGFYTSPLDEEALVHNLEHSQIVFWYDPALPSDVKDDIETIVDRDEDLALVAVPYSEMDTDKGFVITAWGASQACEKVSQDVVGDFRSQFQGKGPEPLVNTFEG